MDENETHAGPPFAGETSIPRNIDLSSLATGPLTRGQVMCRICRLDDRTRAASSPDDLLCDVCRADMPRLIAKERRSALEDAVEKFTGWTDHGGNAAESRTDAIMKFADLVDEFPRPSELVEALRELTRAKPLGALDPTLNAEQLELLRRMAADERANGHHMAAAQLESRADKLEYPIRPVPIGEALEDIPAGKCGTVRLGQELPKRIQSAFPIPAAAAHEPAPEALDSMSRHVQRAVLERVAVEEAEATLQMSRFLAVVEAERQVHGDDAAAAVMWCPVCRVPATDADVRVPADGVRHHKACGLPVQKLSPAERDFRTMIERLTAAGPRIPEPPIVSQNAVQAALEQDIEEIESEHAPNASIGADILAAKLVARGWVPGARRRAAELPKATATIAGVPVPKIARHIPVEADRVGGGLPDNPDRYEEQPVEDADGAVIGHVWEVQPRYCLEHEREWVAAVDGDLSNRPRFGSRDGAEAWVRANALRDGRPLTVPYDAEKVLSVRSEVIGWVWLDPEHAGDDGRWLAVHGSHPEHRHPLFGAGTGELDARNQAIGWVLEQDKEARRG